MFGFLAPPAGPHDLSDADSETDTTSTFSGPSRVGRHDCRQCGGNGGGNLYVSAWTQTEHVAAEAEEGSGYGDAALAARQEGSFPMPPPKRGGAGHDNLLTQGATSSRSPDPSRSRSMPIPLRFKGDC